MKSACRLLQQLPIDRRRGYVHVVLLTHRIEHKRGAPLQEFDDVRKGLVRRGKSHGAIWGGIEARLEPALHRDHASQVLLGPAIQGAVDLIADRGGRLCDGAAQRVAGFPR